MADRMKFVRLMAWTLVVATALAMIDRLSLGPVVREGWTEVSSVKDIEADLRWLPPAYLPGTVVWPPQRILRRVKPERGLWLGLVARDAMGFQVWIGSGKEPLPAELEPLRPCMPEVSGTCPAGWHFASSEGRQQPVFIFSRLDAQQTKRILLGLEPGR